MNPLPQPSPGTTSRAPLNLTDAERQELINRFLATPAAKPPLPINAGLTITVRGETVETSAPMALTEFPEKAVLAKNPLPVGANNVVPE